MYTTFMVRVSSVLAMLISMIYISLLLGAATASVPTLQSEHSAMYLTSNSTNGDGNMNTTMAALLALKQAMLPNDPTRILATMWNSSASPDFCQWRGIYCSNGTHNVIALLLDSHQFSGTLPPQLGHLSHLVYLNLSKNSFSGPIPWELGGLSSLTHLDLSDNQLSGTIPSSLANCTRLQLLDLRINALSGKFPSFLTGFAELVYLDLSQNSFPSETMPPDIGRLSKLEFLQIYDAGLAGHLPLSIINCTRLVWLHLQRNHLTGTLQGDWSRLSRAVQIQLQDNLISGSIPASFGNCTTLLVLDLSNNSLTGELPDSLGKLGLLQYLVVNHNRIGGSIPTSYANCTELITLQLGHNNLTGSIPSGLFRQLKKVLYLALIDNPGLSGKLPHTIGECAQLQVFTASFTALGGPLPASLYNLSSLQILGLSASGLSGSLSEDVQNLTALKKLYLASNTLHGRLPAGLGALAELQGFELQHNHFEGPIPRLWRSNVLVCIDLSFNSLTGAIPAELGQFQLLNNLYLQSNRLSGDIPDVFRSLPGLLNLDLSHNQLTGPLPQSLYVTESLDLSFNNLSGFIPASMGNMRMVITIRLAGNRFKGRVPSALSACQSLEALDLSANDLGGEIPSALVSLVVLQHLNLSHNNLSGNLPQSLGGLRNLVSLDVSYNALQGMIPSVGTYRNSSAAAFMGNPGLCGYPLNQSCLSPTAHHSSGRWSRTVIVSLCTAGGVVMILVCVFVCRSRCQFLSATTKSTEPLQNFIPEKWPLGMHKPDLRKWTARELWEATNGFDEASMIGSGGTSMCFKALVEDEVGTKKLVAVKRLMGRSDQRQDQRSLVQELKILCKVRHRNLVSTLGYCMDEGVVALVLEFMENRNLNERLQGVQAPQILSWGERLRIAADVAEGLVYLHHEYLQPIIHCDLKPANILLGSDMVAKISDFGIARLLDCNETGNSLSTSCHFRGTFGYAAPECAAGTRISTKADVYSFGVLLLELVTGMRPASPQLQAWGISLHIWAREVLQGTHNSTIEASLLDTALQQSIANNPLILQQLEGLLDLGIKCTADMPKMRPNMRYVRETLLNITRPERILRVG